MTSIPLLVEPIEWKQLRRIHLKNKNFFAEFFSAFFGYALHFEHFQKKITLIAYVFQNLSTTKEVLR